MILVVSISAHAFDHVLKIEHRSNIVELQPMVVESHEIVIERYDFEVLVIKNENVAVLKFAKLIKPTANAPPYQCNG